ncbi:MAG: AarF/ABC1/UbiB kinase family protein [Bacteroidetes bacterium]|jgi:ubiquinone biosynthesis protein|nr:AarF/ABC1/UbiB kinase family protein [Bacteroidota bacterium]MDF1863403.1 AarF/ABC1/UbiB kinase family protein [Saprospiraceae bacterium]
MNKTLKIDKPPTTLFRRYEKVIGVFVKYGFEDLIAHPPFNRLIPKSKKLVPFRDGRSVFSYTRYERMRMVCEELGTTFIKFAQIASNRPDVLPVELIEEVTKFQDNALPVPTKAIQKTLNNAYDRPLEEIFESIDYNPIASASMAQVHRAILIGGKEVALKVQRPNIDQTIQLDIQILRSLANFVENNLPQFASFQPRELVKMFEKSILKELNFTIEAANLLRFQKHFKGNNEIYVPSVYPEFSSEKVLCMEFIHGFKITDLEQLENIGLTGKEVALRGINLYFQQVFDHGFFHADPHPGNIFVMVDKKICFVDYGMMGTVVESDKTLLANLLLSVHDRDVVGLKKALLKFGRDVSNIDEKELEYDIREFFSNYSEITLEQIDGDEVIAALNSLFFEYKIKVPSNLLLLLKALVIIEGVGLMIDPKYDLIKNIEPFVRRLIERKYSPKLLTKKAIKALGDLSKLSSKLPEEIDDLIEKLRQGKLQIEVAHKGLEGIQGTMEVISNRISFTLVLVALILGSSIVVLADVPPKMNGIPALGFFGFLISGFFALRLLISIWRHGKF